jgi:Domain of unknown function (DUF6265)
MTTGRTSCGSTTRSFPTRGSSGRPVVTKRIARALVLIACVAWTAVHTGAASADVTRLSWLTGCWALSSGDRVVEEQWMAPRGNTMLGMGRTVRDEKLIEYEVIVIRQEGDHLAYDAHPSGQPPAVFLSHDVTSTSVVFENPGHDFPQRIGYERSGDDALLAWIEGASSGKTRRVEFPYRRARCQ